MKSRFLTTIAITEAYQKPEHQSAPLFFNYAFTIVIIEIESLRQNREKQQTLSWKVHKANMIHISKCLFP